MKLLLALMLIALLIPVLDMLRSGSIWEKLLSFASVSTKTAVVMLVFAEVQQDPMIDFTAVVILSLGNAGLMLLAYLIRRLDVTCD